MDYIDRDMRERGRDAATEGGERGRGRGRGKSFKRGGGGDNVSISSNKSSSHHHHRPTQHRTSSAHSSYNRRDINYPKTTSKNSSTTNE